MLFDSLYRVSNLYLDFSRLVSVILEAFFITLIAAAQIKLLQTNLQIKNMKILKIQLC